MTSVRREPLRRRLQRAHAISASSSVRRAPRSTNDAPSEDDPRRLALARAALDDQALRELATLERAPALDRLIERAGLLASVIESPLPALQKLLPPWPIDRSAGGLLLLQELEDGPVESCPPDLQRLKSRSQDFERDRKSTRLNSSHVRISYAVF